MAGQYLTMFLNVAQIRGARDHGDHVDRTFQPSAFETDDDYRVAAPVRLVFEIFKDASRFRLVGGVVTTLELPCSRCLEVYCSPVDAHFDLRYVPHAQNVGEEEHEVAEDDLSTAYFQDDQIDLGQLMREQFYLALPMKPLCTEECRGLCPQCGMNLNAGSCSCAPAWEDPRLAGLKTLLKKD